MRLGLWGCSGGQPGGWSAKHCSARGGPQEEDRSLVCLQAENPGPATSPCCVRCWVCRGEVNAFSFPSPAPWHRVQGTVSRSRAARCYTRGSHTDICPSSARPSVRVCRLENVVTPPTIQEPRCSFPGGLCPGALGRNLPTRLGS